MSVATNRRPGSADLATTAVTMPRALSAIVWLVSALVCAPAVARDAHPLFLLDHAGPVSPAQVLSLIEDSHGAWRPERTWPEYLSAGSSNGREPVCISIVGTCPPSEEDMANFEETQQVITTLIAKGVNALVVVGCGIGDIVLPFCDDGPDRAAASLEEEREKLKAMREAKKKALEERRAKARAEIEALARGEAGPANLELLHPSARDQLQRDLDRWLLLHGFETLGGSVRVDDGEWGFIQFIGLWPCQTGVSCPW